MAVDANLSAALKDMLKRVTTYDIKALVRPTQPDEVNLKPAQHSIKRIQDYYKSIPKDDLEIASDHAIKVFLEEATKDYALFERVKQYSLEELVRLRSTTINEFAARYDTLFNATYSFAAYMMHARISKLAKTAETSLVHINKVQSETDEKAKQLLEKVDSNILSVLAQVEKEKDSIISEATSILNTIRSTAAEVSVSNQSIYFRNEAQEQSNQALTWKKLLTIAIAAFIPASLFILYIHDIPNLDTNSTAGVIKLVSGKLLVIAVYSYFVIFCAKNYTMHTHNYILNKHRANVLMSYRPIVEAQEKQEDKEIILKSVSDTIFSHQSTGCTSGGSEPNQNLSLEMLVKHLKP